MVLEFTIGGAESSTKKENLTDNLFIPAAKSATYTSLPAVKSREKLSTKIETGENHI